MDRAGKKHRQGVVGEITDHIGLGREAYDRRSWLEAYRNLSLADEEFSLGVEDIERLATAAYLTGSDEGYLRALERAHHTYLETSNWVRGARAAFWIGLRLAFRGEIGQATGWFGRAERLIQREGKACAEEGYLLLPAAEQQLGGGDFGAAYLTAAHAAEIGDRFGESDLAACARHLQGRTLIAQGDIQKGLSLLDEVMVGVISGELSTIMTGLIYCSVVEACQQTYALDRAREWTAALGKWCSEQPELVSFTGTCLVHRAEIMMLNGAWHHAVEEAQHACVRLVEVNNRRDAAAALYQQGEVHRLRGEFPEAEKAYHDASQWGCDPQPGLALLRVAQGRTDAAAASIRRAVSTTTDRLRRARLLPAYVDVMLAVSDLEEAFVACRDLNEIANQLGAEVLRAMAAQAKGAVDLANGHPEDALPALRTALEIWLRFGVPYLAARTRELIGLTYGALRDEEGAHLELAAANDCYKQLGAVPDIVRIASMANESLSVGIASLTRRELEVLRLVATGKPNKVIAAELGLSEKTIGRHMSNIFNKLDVSSRSAATAWAYDHRLVLNQKRSG